MADDPYNFIMKKCPTDRPKWQRWAFQEVRPCRLVVVPIRCASQIRHVDRCGGVVSLPLSPCLFAASPLGFEHIFWNDVDFGEKIVKSTAETTANWLKPLLISMTLSYDQLYSSIGHSYHCTSTTPYLLIILLFPWLFSTLIQLPSLWPG